MPPRSWLCTYCGTDTAHPERPGSALVGAALLLPFIVPGLAYFAWRQTSKRLRCPICGHTQLIPGDAPLARTWRSAGWVPGQPLSAALGGTDPRIERIEQAIDAIALEVERVGRQQRLP